MELVSSIHYLVQQRAEDVRLCVGSVLGTQETPTQTLQ